MEGREHETIPASIFYLNTSWNYHSNTKWEQDAVLFELHKRSFYVTAGSKPWQVTGHTFEFPPGLIKYLSIYLSIFDEDTLLSWSSILYSMTAIFSHCYFLFVHLYVHEFFLVCFESTVTVKTTKVKTELMPTNQPVCSHEGLLTCLQLWNAGKPFFSLCLLFVICNATKVIKQMYLSKK